MPVGDELRGDDVDRHPVLGVHHDQPAVLRGLLHRPEDRPVVAVEDARIGGEQLEVRDALGDELVHLRERVVVDVAHDHVEAVVGDGVALGLGVPRVEALAQRLALRLDGEVDDRRRAAEGRRARPRLERVLRERPAERQLHVGVDVDPARDHVLAGGVDRLVGGHAAGRQARADLGDRLAVDQDVGGVRAVGGDDRAVGDERAHRDGPPRRCAGLGRRGLVRRASYRSGERRDRARRRAGSGGSGRRPPRRASVATGSPDAEQRRERRHEESEQDHAAGPGSAAAPRRPTARRRRDRHGRDSTRAVGRPRVRAAATGRGVGGRGVARAGPAGRRRGRPAGWSGGASASAGRGRTAAARRRSRSAGCSGPGSCCPEPSSCSVRMCHGAPETIAAPSRGPPRGRVPVRRLGEVAAPCEEHRRAAST